MRLIRSEPILLWFDLETTGLNVVNGLDEILEVGYGISTLDLRWIQKPKSILIESHLTEAALYERSDEYVQKMHEASGLWADRMDAYRYCVPLAAVEIGIMDVIHDLVDPDTAVTMAGSGIGTFDIPIVKAYMPTLAERITYYPFDISNVERFLQWVGTGGFRSTSKTADHRAVADIEFAYGQLIQMHSTIAYQSINWREAFPRWF